MLLFSGTSLLALFCVSGASLLRCRLWETGWFAEFSWDLLSLPRHASVYFTLLRCCSLDLGLHHNLKILNEAIPKGGSLERELSMAGWLPGIPPPPPPTHECLYQACPGGRQPGAGPGPWQQARYSQPWQQTSSILWTLWAGTSSMIGTGEGLSAGGDRSDVTIALCCLQLGRY